MSTVTTPRRVLDPSQIPTRPPVLLSAVIWLLLDRFDASGFVRGAVAVLVALIWFSYFLSWHAERYTRVRELDIPPEQDR